MKPGNLMIFGAVTALVALFGTWAGLPFEVAIFAGGALFGKGYGVWEARFSLPSDQDTKRAG